MKRINNIINYISYVKSKGFKNYYSYLKLKNIAESFGIELLDYEETIKRLWQIARMINDATPTAEEFAKNMFDIFNKKSGYCMQDSDGNKIYIENDAGD